MKYGKTGPKADTDGCGWTDDNPQLEPEYKEEIGDVANDNHTAVDSKVE